MIRRWTLSTGASSFSWPRLTRSWFQSPELYFSAIAGRRQSANRRKQPSHSCSWLGMTRRVEDERSCGGACWGRASRNSSDPRELGQTWNVALSGRRRHVLRLLDRRLRHPAPREHKLASAVSDPRHQSNRVHDLFANRQQRLDGTFPLGNPERRFAKVQEVSWPSDLGGTYILGVPGLRVDTSDYGSVATS